MNNLTDLRRFQAQLINNRIMTEFVFPMWYHDEAGEIDEDAASGNILYWDTAKRNARITYNDKNEIRSIKAVVDADGYEWDVTIAIYFDNPSDEDSEDERSYRISPSCGHSGVNGSYGLDGVEYVMTHYPAIADWSLMTSLCDELAKLADEIYEDKIKGVPLWKAGQKKEEDDETE